MNISPTELRKMLDYNPATGRLTWHKSRARRPGRVAGFTHKRLGYVVLKIEGKSCLAHRVAWAHFHGEWPSQDIDHANLNKADNRIDNLRLATKSQNSMNQRARHTNKSGLKGVTFKSSRKSWVANIWLDKRQQHLGTFATAEEAHAAYAAAAKARFGEFARAA